MSKQTLKLKHDKKYLSFLQEVKSRIQTTRIKIAVEANKELIIFYWSIGKLIIDQQALSNWGDKLIEELAADLKTSFPDSQGFSRTNLHGMKKFAEAYGDFKIVQTLSEQLPWSHHLAIITNIKAKEERMWYINQAYTNGWSYRMLMHNIDQDLYNSQGRKKIKTTNFSLQLPNQQSELAQEIIRDPYKFHFLTIGDDAHEKEIHKGLISHVNQFLLALGQGFAYYGSHYPLKISHKTYELDLLMYHTKLHCYVVVELKRGAFNPRDTGQLNFYLSAVDSKLKLPEDNPTIGLLLCEEKDKVVAEYALRDVNKPMGISVYEVTKALPKEIRGILPTIESIEAELNVDLKKRSKMQ